MIKKYFTNKNLIQLIVIFLLSTNSYSQCSSIYLGGGNYISEISVTITSCDGSVIFQSPENLTNTFTDCIDLPDSYLIQMTDSYGDGWTGNILSIDNQTYSMSCMWPSCNSETIQVNTCLGCTDETACNYSEYSQEDDGSCIYFIDCNGI